jgi:hypothetical protein
MSKRLKSKGLKVYSPMALRTNRTFYRPYSQIQQTVFVELQKAEININKLFPFKIPVIPQTASIRQGWTHLSDTNENYLESEVLTFIKDHLKSDGTIWEKRTQN